MNGADTAWIMVATALVLFMTLPGLALFYGGLVRARNVLSVFMHCYAIACLMSILWFVFGYSIAFGGGTSGVWGGGFLADGGIFGATGVRDFAGGIVVHETAGIAALIIAVFLGARRNRNTPPHNPGFVMIGAAMLWVGWFGFNGGSQLAADGGAAMAITVTHLSAAAASLTWALWERIKYGKASMVGLVTGTIAGLASITPASGFVGPVEALIIGAIAGVGCQEAVLLVRNKLRIDDTLDVFAVHGVGGIFGTIMIAVFGAGTWAAQLGSLAIVGVFTVVMTVVLVKIVSLVTPLRVDHETETNGLDLSVHGERAYDMSS
jgi:Amt family ammonium transporter